jgi:hypothetical protein
MKIQPELTSLRASVERSDDPTVLQAKEAAAPALVKTPLIFITREWLRRRTGQIQQLVHLLEKMAVRTH